MFKILPGVCITGLKPELLLAVLAAHDFCNAMQEDCIISFVSYDSYVITFDAKNMISTMQEMFEINLTRALNVEYSVTLNKGDINVEFK